MVVGPSPSSISRFLKYFSGTLQALVGIWSPSAFAALVFHTVGWRGTLLRCETMSSPLFQAERGTDPPAPGCANTPVSGASLQRWPWLSSCHYTSTSPLLWVRYAPSTHPTQSHKGNWDSTWLSQDNFSFCFEHL